MKAFLHLLFPGVYFLLVSFMAIAPFEIISYIPFSFLSVNSIRADIVYLVHYRGLTVHHRMYNALQREGAPLPVCGLIA